MCRDVHLIRSKRPRSCQCIDWTDTSPSETPRCQTPSRTNATRLAADRDPKLSNLIQGMVGSTGSSSFGPFLTHRQMRSGKLLLLPTLSDAGEIWNVTAQELAFKILCYLIKCLVSLASIHIFPLSSPAIWRISAHWPFFSPSVIPSVSQTS